MNTFQVTIALLAALAAGSVVAAEPPTPPGSTPATMPASPLGARVTKDGWFAPRMPGKKPPALPDRVTKAFVIPIHGPVGAATLESVKREIVRCRAQGAELVILDIDTPGGRVDVMNGIVDLLTAELKNVRRVAYVNPNAYSAGAIISLACHEIVMAERAVIGDAMPILTGPDGKVMPIPDRERAKIESPLIALAKDLAQENGHNEALCKGMITLSIEVWLIRNRKTGQMRVVNPDSADWRAKVFNAPKRSRNAPPPPADSPWEFVHLVDRGINQLVTMSTRDAKRFGFVNHAFATMDDLLAHYNVMPAPPAGARITSDGWFAPRKPKKSPPALPDRVTKAFVIPIHGPITPTTLDSVKRKIVKCRTGQAELVIFDMNTPGGRVDVMNSIVDLLVKELADVRRVAYVNPNAYSAGAIISLACHDIVMTERAVIGDAMPIMFGPQGLMPVPDKERAKIESPLIALAKDLAQENGYNEALCEGMVTVSIEVWLIRNRKTGEMRAVDANNANWRPKVLNAPRRKKDDVEPLADAEWEFVALADRSKNQLVTLKTRAALRFGFVDHQFVTLDDLLKHYNVTEPPVVLGDTWSEKLVGWLTSTAVTSLLMGLGMLCVFIEIRTPGLGLPGLIALICFVIVFGSQYLIGLAAWWEIAVFMIGLVLIALEIFVIPGFGVAGISGMACCLIGLLAMFVDNPPNSMPIPRGELSWEMFSSGVFALACAFVGAAVAGALLGRYLQKIPFVNRLCLAAVTAVQPQVPVTADAPVRRVQVGDRGVVASMCRPIGKVRFGDNLIDAASEGETIEPGTPVCVLRLDSNRLVVKRIEEA